MRNRFLNWMVFTTVLSLPIAGCGGNDDNGGGGSNSTDMVGTLAGVNETGSIAIAIPLGTLAAPPAPAGNPLQETARAPVDVSGTLHIAGGSDIALTGTYDPSSHALGITGGGYTLVGSFSGTAIDGTYTGPNGSGGFSLEIGASNKILVICGTFSGTNDGSPESGMFNMVLNTSSNKGRVLVVDGAGGSGVLSVTKSGGNLTVFVPGQPSNVIATGTISSTAADGDYDDGQGASGTWSGNSSACQ